MIKEQDKEFLSLYKILNFKDEICKSVEDISFLIYDDIKIYRKDWLANIIAHIDYDNISVIEKIDEEIDYTKNKLKKM